MVDWFIRQGIPLKLPEGEPDSPESLRPLHLASSAGFRVEKSTLLPQPWRIAWRDTDDIPTRCAETVRVLLESGASANELDGRHLAPLHHAAIAGQARATTLLLDHGADVNLCPPPEAITPLGLAAQVDATDTMRILLARGALLRMPLEMEPPLHKAARNGKIDAARLLLEHGADASTRDTQLATPLHRAAAVGHEALVGLLIDHHADVNARDANRATPLHFAAAQGHLPVVRLLCARGANVQARMISGDSTATQAATMAGHTAVAQFLELIEERQSAIPAR